MSLLPGCFVCDRPVANPYAPSALCGIECRDAGRIRGIRCRPRSKRPAVHD
jgi:hypothetical protein